MRATHSGCPIFAMALLNIFLDTDKRYYPKAEYVFRFFCRCLGLSPRFLYEVCDEDVHIYYGANLYAKFPINIYHNIEAVSFFDDVRCYPNDAVNFYKYHDIYIPFLFSLNGNISEYAEGRTIVAKDIVSSAFYFLSCWQEYVDDAINGVCDRYDFGKSMQHFWDFAEIPVVDYYSRIFEDSLRHTYKELTLKKPFTDKGVFAVTLSHDIDYYDFWNKKHLRDVYQYNLNKLSHKPVRAIYKLIGHFVTKHFCYDAKSHLNKMFGKEQKIIEPRTAESKSTSFLITQPDGSDERQAYFTNKEILEKIKSIFHQRSVGLHGTKDASVNADEMRTQIALAKENGLDIKGYRAHYLNFNYQRSFEVLEKTALVYDATLGFGEQIGYRAGTSLPFYPFNIKEDRAFEVLEIPLTIMDVTLFAEKNMNLSYRKAKKRIFEMIDNAAENNAHISILWHDTNFDRIDYPRWEKLYWQCIKYARKKKAWICSIDEMAILSPSL